ncbi:hypothetical protein [Gemmatimonas sp.]|jgi:hypothetical protein|nr:hypothetical protein [Gemmatimonas sp.]MCA2984126.1 hypothetical protein [Gemmatimonas sp.]MCA2987223.1 hypothetical protein [Gemmatimonas sp.]MCA2991454.1 hypothetical protein [Gemmatimonas sp.]MCA2995439.1 hypothetical protein [Gemmatimonas sp.]MCE2953471.1 hypothetical protein [Gemmatimonas sp.]
MPMLPHMTALPLATGRLIGALPVVVTMLVAAILVVFSTREQGRTVASM